MIYLELVDLRKKKPYDMVNNTNGYAGLKYAICKKIIFSQALFTHFAPEDWNILKSALGPGQLECS